MKTNKRGKKTNRTTERLGSVKIKLSKKIFETMVCNVLKNLYDTGPHGQLCYSINDAAMKSLKESSELFLQQMWEQLRHEVSKSHTNTITSQHVQSWKQTTNFKRRFKTNDLSLCEMFKSV